MLSFARAAAAGLSGQRPPMADLERERFMAGEALRRHVAGCEALLLCRRQEQLERFIAEKVSVEKTTTSRWSKEVDG